MPSVSGTRWYRAYPTPLTQTVVVANDNLFVGSDPNPTYPYAALTSVAAFERGQSSPSCFAPVRDPAANFGYGWDVLVITGCTGPYGFATGSLSLNGPPTLNQTVSVTMNGVTAGPYTVLQTDDLASIAQELVNLINASSAVAQGSPFLNQATFSQPVPNGPVTINLYALQSGTTGNSITYSGTVAGASGGLAISPTTATNMTGGGATTSAPLKYDGSTVSGLSGQITNPFTGCVTWHDHVWYWGDPAHPDTLFASDLNQPESFSFMLQYGGYDIGAGDGDASIRACVPAGNILYVFKGQSIYAITGYDFQAGEYQFSVAPAIAGHGTPNAQSVAVLDNALVFWDGRGFYRLQPGAFSVEHIGMTIPMTEGRASQGNQSLVRACAGSFVVSSLLNESFFAAAPQAYELFSSVAFFAVDTGSGVADTVLVYDDDATKYLGNYAWAPWTGWTVDAWLPFGAGQNSAQSAQDQPLLCWISNTNLGPVLSAYGASVAADSGVAIPFLAQTGWITLGTGTNEKELHRLLMELEASSGAFVTFNVTPAATIDQSGNPRLYVPVAGSFAATGGPSGAEAHQTMIAAISPFLRADAFLIAFGEFSGIAQIELVNLTLDLLIEPHRP